MIIQPVSFFSFLKSGAKRLGHFGGAKVLAAHAGAGVGEVILCKKGHGEKQNGQ